MPDSTRAILDAALVEFDRHGIRRVALDDVARRAGGVGRRSTGGSRTRTNSRRRVSTGRTQLFENIALELKSAPPQSNYYVEGVHLGDAALPASIGSPAPHVHRRTGAQPGACQLHYDAAVTRIETALRVIFPPGFAERRGPEVVRELADNIGATRS